MIKKYRKNKTEVEAIQYLRSQESMDEILEWIGDRLIYSGKKESDLSFNLISTKLGKETIIYGTNWIIKDGRYLFVISDDIFIDMYTEVV